ncbi:MAG: GC-type dockerin domain-anchored protein [Planctomycetota bacterium]
MQRLTIAAGLWCASAATSQNLAISFQPTGEPNTYDMVAELFWPLPFPINDQPSDLGSVWAEVDVRLEGDGPITILQWNPAYDNPISPAEVVGNGTASVEFDGFQTSFFGATMDPSNPLQVLRFRYDGTLEAFSSEMFGVNSLIFLTPPLGSVYRYTDISDRPRVPELTHSFGPLPGVDCPADINGDGALSPGDFNAWVIAFNNQSAGCDQNGDGLCTPGDFNAWVINYNAGC